MLHRDLTDQLINWKDQKPHHCLMIRGARQVGKTTSITAFGESCYTSFISINFLETPALKAVFSGNLDVETMLLNFSLYLPHARFIPGETLLFLDEIQECPEAITSLKFWAADSRFDVIASGSMLGIDVHRPSSYPVGSIDYIDMYSLSFREFLVAMEIGNPILDTLRGHFDTLTPVPDAIHRRIMELLRLYLVIGGMPEVVTVFLSEHSIASADTKQRAILNDYRYDIAHYAPPEQKIKAEKCYFSLPEQLSKENHKFQYSVVETGTNARKYKNSMDWLAEAGLIRYCPNIKKIAQPLRSYADHTNFRVYPSDTGLLMAMYSFPTKELILADSIERRDIEIKGGLYEALIADMLIKAGHSSLFYYKNETSTQEIEFLIENRDGLIPVEVKAGNSRSKSLDRLLERNDIPYGYKLVDGNIGQTGKKITLPLYMGMFLG